MNRLKPHPSILLALILALSAAGAWISGQMVKQHAGLWAAQDGPRGLFGLGCKAAGAVGLGGCDSTSKGGWSEITLPLPVPSLDLTVSVRWVLIPVSFLGLAYFVSVAVWFGLIGGRRSYGRGWHRVPLALAVVGVAVSVLYLAVMAFGLAPWCIWCLAVHGVNVLMAGAIWRVCRGQRASGIHAGSVAAPPEELGGLTLTSREAARAIVCSLLVIAGLWAYRNERLVLHHKWNKLVPYKALVMSLQKDPEFLLREYYAQPQNHISPRPTESAAPNSPQLVIFTDFECSACSCTSRWMREIAAKTFEGRLSVWVRHYPLCKACNDRVKGELHPNACQAAYAAEAARIVGGEKAFWQMYDLLFKNRKRLGEQIYRDLAVRIGLDPDRFLAEMQSDTVRQIVESDIELAKKLGVVGTPTMFVDGRRITALCQTPRFWQALAEARPRSPGEDAPTVAGSHPLRTTGSHCLESRGQPL